MKVIMG